jgi:hypothetical protein
MQLQQVTELERGRELALAQQETAALAKVRIYFKNPLKRLFVHLHCELKHNSWWKRANSKNSNDRLLLQFQASINKIWFFRSNTLPRLGRQVFFFVFCGFLKQNLYAAPTRA